MYLYHAVDSDGNTIDFLFSKTRDVKAAKRFLKKSSLSSIDSTVEKGKKDAGRHPSETNKISEQYHGTSIFHGENQINEKIHYYFCRIIGKDGVFVCIFLYLMN